MSNHLKDLADQLEAVAVEVNLADRNVPLRDGDVPRESHLRAAAAVLKTIACVHNPVTLITDEKDAQGDTPARVACQFCDVDLVQIWVARS